MRILAIETSCDETAIAIINWNKKTNTINVLANLVSSQVEIHRPFGGVVPNLARREHENNLVPILIGALKKANLIDENSSKLKIGKLNSILKREPTLLEHFKKEILKINIPNIDAVAVTYGPGLAPALWVGLNFAKTLSYIWKKPLIPVNHMEGHIFSALIKKNGKTPNYKLQTITYPSIALLVSGGHTELILIKKPGHYKIIGETIDDAAGEAFDKVARILNLPYPGGPEISKLANLPNIKFELPNKLPRPMIHSKDFNFSFSGLKTATLYMVRDLSAKKSLTEDAKAAIAKEFQNAVIEVLVSKTINAINTYGAKSLILGGGVAANFLLRKELGKTLNKKIKNSKFYIPNSTHTGDNALMIAIAAAVTGKKTLPSKILAMSNLTL